MKNTKNSEVKTKKNINIGAIYNSILSYVAMVLLAGFAYVGVQSLVDAKPMIQTGIAILVTMLLVKTALNK